MSLNFLSIQHPIVRNHRLKDNQSHLELVLAQRIVAPLQPDRTLMSLDEGPLWALPVLATGFYLTIRGLIF